MKKYKDVFKGETPVDNTGEIPEKMNKNYYIRKDQKMRHVCIEDQIAEQLKDICNHKATYVIRFNYGNIEVEEVHEDKPKNDGDVYPNIFDRE